MTGICEIETVVRQGRRAEREKCMGLAQYHWVYMSRTTGFSPAALTIGQKVSLQTSVTCPVTATAAVGVSTSSAPVVAVSKPPDFTGVTPLASEADTTIRLLF